VSPVRLALLALLFYIAYRLYIGIGKNKRHKSDTKPTDIKPLPMVSDVLMEDPVCHTLIPKGQAIRLQHKDRLYYFCSKTCCSQFISEKGEKK
jgi:YHS domain-containing protein